MSDERFDRIERLLGGLKADVAGLTTDVAALKTDVAGLKTDVAGLKIDVAGLKTDVAGLTTDMAGVKADIGGLKGEIRRLDRTTADLAAHMRDLHNETVRQIGALAESVAAVDGKIDRKAAEIVETIGRRLDPLEAVVREHSVRLDRLEARSG